MGDSSAIRAERQPMEGGLASEGGLRYTDPDSVPICPPPSPWLTSLSPFPLMLRRSCCLSLAVWAGESQGGCRQHLSLSLAEKLVGAEEGGQSWGKGLLPVYSDPVSTNKKRAMKWFWHWNLCHRVSAEFFFPSGNPLKGEWGSFPVTLLLSSFQFLLLIAGHFTFLFEYYFFFPLLSVSFSLFSLFLELVVGIYLLVLCVFSVFLLVLFFLKIV